MKMKVLIEDKNYTNWKYYEADSFQEINLENNINPAIFKLFTEDVFTLVVDDANIENNVRITKRYIEDLGLKVLYERELLNDLEDPEMWWNGLYVTVLQKQI